MCTLSLVPSRDGSVLRAVMNRDERRTRMAAEPPRAVATAAGVAVWPRDLEAGGTWIAANDAGLCFALLNVNARDRRRAPLATLSRGHVIPALAHARRLEDVDAAWHELRWNGMDSFRLVVASRHTIWVGEHRAGGPYVPAHTQRVSSSGQVFTSSGLGDAAVDGCRRDLFAALVGSHAQPWLGQDRFHQHEWPDRRHVSVLMSRADACTVSRTEVQLAADRAEMRYCPVVDGWPAAVCTRSVAVFAGRREAAA